MRRQATSDFIKMSSTGGISVFFLLYWVTVWAAAVRDGDVVKLSESRRQWKREVSLSKVKDGTACNIVLPYFCEVFQYPHFICHTTFNFWAAASFCWFILAVCCRESEVPNITWAAGAHVKVIDGGNSLDVTLGEVCFFFFFFPGRRLRVIMLWQLHCLDFNWKINLFQYCCLSSVLHYLTPGHNIMHWNLCSTFKLVSCL